MVSHLFDIDWQQCIIFSGIYSLIYSSQTSKWFDEIFTSEPFLFRDLQTFDKRYIDSIFYINHEKKTPPTPTQRFLPNLNSAGSCDENTREKIFFFELFRPLYRLFLFCGYIFSLQASKLQLYRSLNASALFLFHHSKSVFLVLNSWKIFLSYLFICQVQRDKIDMNWSFEYT